MKNFIIFLILTFFSFNTYAKTTYIYSPVPTGSRETIVADNQPLVDYLSGETKKNIKIKFLDDHKKVIDEFVQGQIDIAYVGPVPFIVLKSKYKHFEPLAMVNEKDGTHYYRCVLFTTSDKEVNFKSIKKIAMTNPLSTCGYTFVYHALKKHKIDINKLGYEYIGNHEDVVHKVLAGMYDAGGVKESVFEKYKHVGLKSISVSDELPSFIIVANTKTVSSKDIETIKQSLLNINNSVLSSLKVGKYGFSKYDKTKYDNFEKLLTNDILRAIYE